MYKKYYLFSEVQFMRLCDLPSVLIASICKELRENVGTAMYFICEKAFLNSRLFELDEYVDVWKYVHII